MKNTSYLTEPELQKTLGIKSVDEKLRSTPYMLISSEQKKTNPFATNKKVENTIPLPRPKSFQTVPLPRTIAVRRIQGIPSRRKTSYQKERRKTSHPLLM